MPRRFASLLVIVLLASSLVAGCSATSPGSSTGLTVVAAENFWGSIASQLAGNRATVRSIVTDPAQDPHSYEPTAADARTLATARLVIVNGLGYDPWAARLLNANPASGRRVLTVGSSLGLGEGSNPHRWYDPADVEAIARAITAELVSLQPSQSAYYRGRLTQFETQGLRGYHDLIATIKARYGGVAVGTSESIFALLSPALGLKLLTPDGLMKAVSEGTDITAQDASAAEAQIARHQIAVWIYNIQNQTPEVQHLNSLARARGIQIVTITETLMPATASFQQWQTSQLERLALALRRATSR